MIRYQHLSIAGKLRWMILLAVVIVVTLVSVSHIAHTVYAHRDTTLQRVAGVAELLAFSTRAAITFEDAAVANDLLNALEADRDIAYAQVILPTTESFASYSRDGLPPVAIDDVPVPVDGQSAYRFSLNVLQYSAPVVVDGELVGGIYIEASLSAMYAQLFSSVVIALVIAALAILAAALLSTRLQRVISQPIRALVKAMANVSVDDVQATPVAKTSDDEIGTLIDGFNEMLAQIKTRDERLAEHRRSLERKVEERTERLSRANTELQSAVDEMHLAKEAAEKASRAKGEFLARMSHEIRTPMNGVLGMSELLHTTPLSKRQQRYAQTIRRSTEALLAVVNDILDYSKIEARRLELEKLEFNLHDLVEDVAELLAETAHAKGIELVCRLSKSVPCRVVGDPTRLRQVLINLLGNAIKFTEQGEVVLEVGYRGSTPNGSMLHFSVRDTGIGIAPDQIDRLFESFEQAASYTTRKYGGTGLGLAISRQIVVAMGGEIRVHTEQGKGSVFMFDIDMHHGHSDLDESDFAKALGRRQILVVDDNETNRNILQEQLESVSAVPLTVADAEAALVALKDEHEFAAIILDCNMPGMDGFELATEIRRIKILAEVPVLMLSSVGRFDQPGINGAKDAIDAYLCKPARKRHLLELLVQLIEGENPQSDQPHLDDDYLEAALGLSVLVAEDQVVNQSVAVGLLETLGCRADIAENGAEALSLVSENAYDVVLMDCQMPVMDGLEATRRLRQREDTNSLPRTPVIALTANASTEDREACANAGMDDFLSKPFSRAALAELLQRHADVPVGSQALSPAAPVEETAESGDVLDELALANIRSLSTTANPGAFQRIVEGFFASMPTQLEQLKEAAESQDTETLWRIAHGMKSTCANLGAGRLAGRLKQLEQEGKDNNIVDVSAQVAAICEEYLKVRDALELQLTGEVA